MVQWCVDGLFKPSSTTIFPVGFSAVYKARVYFWTQHFMDTFIRQHDRKTDKENIIQQTVTQYTYKIQTH